MSQLSRIYYYLITSIAFLCVSAHARVGESRGALEGRLLQSSPKLAIRYPRDYAESGLNQSGGHYKKLMIMLEFKYEKHKSDTPEMTFVLSRISNEMEAVRKNISAEIYYKPSNGSRASATSFDPDNDNDIDNTTSKKKKETHKRGNRKYATPNGWHFLVIYYNGVSIFESYRKTGTTIIEAERNYILSMNTKDGQSKWIQTTSTAQTSPKDTQVAPSNEASKNATSKTQDEFDARSFFGFQIERQDKVLRAKLSGSSIIIYDAKFDKDLASKSHHIDKVKYNKLALDVSTSVYGF